MKRRRLPISFSGAASRSAAEVDVFGMVRPIGLQSSRSRIAAALDYTVDRVFHSHGGTQAMCSRFRGIKATLRSLSKRIRRVNTLPAKVNGE
jgi:hypothetical protein